MRARKIFAAGATVLMLASHGCSGTPSPASTASSGARPKLTVTGSVFLSHAPFLLALDSRDFEAEGIDVDYRIGRASDAMVSLAAGRVDIVVGSVTVGFMNMVAHGADARIVADKGYGPSRACSERALVARREIIGRLKSGATARGLRADATKASAAEYYFELAATEAGLHTEDFVRTAVPNSELVTAIEAGLMDVAQVPEPFLHQALRSGKVEVWRPNDPRVPGGVIFFSGSLLKERRELGRRFLRGYLRGVARLREGKTEANIAALQRRLGFDRATLTGACWPEVREDARLDPEPLRGFTDWALRRGYLEAQVDASRAIDLSLLDEIAKENAPRIPRS